MDKISKAKHQKIDEILKRMDGAIDYNGSASELIHELLDEN